MILDNPEYSCCEWANTIHIQYEETKHFQIRPNSPSVCVGCYVETLGGMDRLKNILIVILLICFAVVVFAYLQLSSDVKALLEILTED